jgi:hypothetical protein
MTQFPAKIWVLSNLDAALGYGGGTGMSFLRLRATVFPAERYPIQSLVNIQSRLITDSLSARQRCTSDFATLNRPALI